MSDGVVTVYADGSCLGNPGPGGWAVIMSRGRESRTIQGSETETTNNRMEMTAVVQALLSMKTDAPILFKLDSKYVLEGITRWIDGWKAKGWRRSDGKPVLNVDLWQALEAAIGQRKVSWQWVKGHASDPLNNRVDALAREAAERQLPLTVT